MYKADVWLSIGPNCRTISYLRDFGLTWFAAPSDWMIFPDLNTLLHMYRSRFFGFFKKIEEYQEPGEGPHRFLRDVRYDIACIHHVEKQVSLKEGRIRVRRRAILRAWKTTVVLKQARNIGLVGNWSASKEELCCFLKNFARMYPGRKITLYNLSHVPGETGYRKTETVLSPLLSLVEYFFDDTGEQGSPDEWKGNREIWSQIIGLFRLNETDQRINKTMGR